MATRSTISKIKKDGSVETIYCHNDGYLEHHAPILKKYYTNLTAINTLLNKGDMSVLSNSADNSTFYRRDMKRKKSECAKRTISFESFLNNSLQDYNYIFKNKKWYVIKYSDPTRQMIEL